MRAELGLPSVRGDDEKGGGMMGGFGGSMGGVGAGGKAKRPISVKFEIPYFTTSGIQVRYLKIIEPKVSLHEYSRERGISILTAHSFNTRLCHGCDTSHRVATSRCVCRMCSEGEMQTRELDTTNCYRDGLVLLSIAMAYWRVGEFFSLAGYLRGHHDDSAPGAVKYRNTSRDSRSD